MRFLEKVKDGGKDSPVDAYVLLEIKCLFSIMVLKFNKGSRVAFHTHAFNALTWFIKGNMYEHKITRLGEPKTQYTRSVLPKVTTKDNLHKVVAVEDSWCFTLRGKWQDTWEEYCPESKEHTTLTHGRKVIRTYK